MSADSETLLRIAQVDPTHADTLRRLPTTLTRQPLGFYKRFQLLQAEVRLPHRPLLLQYADDGRRVINLMTGQPQAIYQLNVEEGLELGPAQVPEYLKFFVAHTDGGSRRVVEGEQDVRWLPATAMDAALGARKADAVAKLHPVRVTPTEQGFEATAVVLSGAQLLACRYRVRTAGRVEAVGSEVLADALPVPAVS